MKKEDMGRKENQMCPLMSPALFLSNWFSPPLLYKISSWSYVRLRRIYYCQKKAFTTKRLGSPEQKSMLSSVIKGYLSTQVPSGFLLRQLAWNHLLSLQKHKQAVPLNTGWAGRVQDHLLVLCNTENFISRMPRHENLWEDYKI